MYSARQLSDLLALFVAPKFLLTEWLHACSAMQIVLVKSEIIRILRAWMLWNTRVIANVFCSSLSSLDSAASSTIQLNRIIEQHYDVKLYNKKRKEYPVPLMKTARLPLFLEFRNVRSTGSTGKLDGNTRSPHGFKETERPAVDAKGRDRTRCVRPSDSGSDIRSARYRRRDNDWLAAAPRRCSLSPDKTFPGPVGSDVNSPSDWLIRIPTPPFSRERGEGDD